jgi:hypothetical protein
MKWRGMLRARKKWKMHITFYSGKLIEGNNLEELGVDRKKILEWVLIK